MRIRQRNRLLSALVLAMVLAIVAAACGNDDDSSDSGASPTGGGGETLDLSGEITGSGASFPDACYQAAIAAFTDVAPDLTVTYNSIGSGSGKEEFGQDLNDFAGSDSLVDEGDGPEPGSFFYIPSTASSVTVSYNLPDVDELKLNGPVIAQIFQRDITTWDDPAITELNPDADLPSTEITVARRSDGSGTTNNFTKYLDAAAPGVWTLGADDTVEWPADTVGGAQNTGVAQIVQDTEGAVGYVDLGDAQVIGLQTAAIENKEGNFVEPSVDGTTAALAGATLADDLTYNPLDGPGADAYPITAPTYILVHTSYDDTQVGNDVVGFVKWLITDGVSQNCEDVSFAPTPQEFQDAAVAQLDEVQIG